MSVKRLFANNCKSNSFYATAGLFYKAKNLLVGQSVVGYDRKRIFWPHTGMEAKSGSGKAGNGLLF